MGVQEFEEPLISNAAADDEDVAARGEEFAEPFDMRFRADEFVLPGWNGQRRVEWRVTGKKIRWAKHAWIAEVGRPLGGRVN